MSGELDTSTPTDESWKVGQPSKQRNPFLVALLALAVVVALGAIITGMTAQYQADQDLSYGRALAVLKVSDMLWAFSGMLAVGWLVAAAVTWRPKA